MEEHRIAPNRGNVISGGFAFIVTILLTIILADLLRAVVRNVSLNSLAITGNNVALGILTVAILLEVLIAAFDNYAYTRERDDPLHRGIVKFEIVRYLITFFSVTVLFLGVTSVATVWKGDGDLSTAAGVVTIVIWTRYLTEGVWQVSAMVRSYYLTFRNPDSVATTDGCDPYTDEAFRTLGLSSRGDGIVRTLQNFDCTSYPGLMLISTIGGVFILFSPSATGDAVIAGGVVFVTEYLYIKIWAAQYYYPLLNLEEPLISDEDINPDNEDADLEIGGVDSSVRSAFDSYLSNNEDVSPERLVREIKFYHDDPRYEFRVGEEGDGMADLLKTMRRDDVSSTERVKEFCNPPRPNEKSPTDDS